LRMPYLANNNGCENESDCNGIGFSNSEILINERNAVRKSSVIENGPEPGDHTTRLERH